MKHLSLIFLFLLTVLPAWGQAPIRRQFFTTNDNPIVDVVAGSNVTVQASTPAANIRRFTVNSIPGAGQTNVTVVIQGTNTVVLTNSSGGVTAYTVSSTATGGGTGSSNITDSAYYAVARNLTVNTNANINNLTVTNLTVDSGSGIGYLSLENSGTNIIVLNGTNGVITASSFTGSGTNLTGVILGVEAGTNGIQVITNGSVVTVSYNGTNGMAVAAGTNIVVVTNSSLATVSLATNPVVASLTTYGGDTNTFGASLFTNGLYVTTTGTNVFGASVFTNGIYGDGSGLTNLNVVGLSNITDSGYVALARNLTVSTNATFAGSVISTNGYTSTGTNAIYSLWSSGTDYERYLFEPGDKQLTIRADTAGSGDDDLNLSIMLNGAGTFSVHAHTNVIAATRGTNSADLQLQRFNANNVTSGDCSGLLAGSDNRSSGYLSSVVGGIGNIASGVRSAVIGSLVTTASGQDSTAIGSRSTTVSGTHSSSIGAEFGADDGKSFSLLSGSGARATMLGQTVRAYNPFLIRINQRSGFHMGQHSSGLTPTNIWNSSGNSAIIMPVNSTWTFSGIVTGRSADNGVGNEKSGGWKIDGVIEREVAANEIRFVGSPIITCLGKDDSAWDVTVVADTITGALGVKVNGNTSDEVNWSLSLDLSEVGE